MWWCPGRRCADWMGRQVGHFHARRRLRGLPGRAVRLNAGPRGTQTGMEVPVGRRRRNPRIGGYRTLVGRQLIVSANRLKVDVHHIFYIHQKHLNTSVYILNLHKRSQSNYFKSVKDSNGERKENRAYLWVPFRLLSWYRQIKTEKYHNRHQTNLLKFVLCIPSG